MTASELMSLSLAEAADLVSKREVSPVDLAEAALDQIDLSNPKVNAFLTLCGEQAIIAAHRAEREILIGRYRGPLHGIPYSVKDIYATKGIRTTCGSAVFADRVPDFDSTAVRRLNRAGGVLIGKNHCSEFACGDHADAYGPVHNPWNLEHTPGGSSSGSAASVASGMVFASMGSCTGGSIRGPASNCSVVGLKPSYGLVSRYGVFPLSWSLDHAGPLTRTVEDCALVLGAVAGYDEKDPSSIRSPAFDYVSNLRAGIRGLRVGLPREFNEQASPEVSVLIRQAVSQLGELGATVEEIFVPMTGQYATTAGNVITWSEEAEVHSQWLDRLEDYTAGARQKVLVGLTLSSAAYHKAQQMRSVVSNELNDALERFDVLVSPVSGSPPGLLQATAPLADAGASRMATSPSLTRPYNLTGMPAISVPCGFTTNGLPVGLQIAGRMLEDATVLRVAYAYEQATAWYTMHPTP